MKYCLIYEHGGALFIMKLPTDDIKTQNRRTLYFFSGLFAFCKTSFLYLKVLFLLFYLLINETLYFGVYLFYFIRFELPRTFHDQKEKTKKKTQQPTENNEFDNNSSGCYFIC